SGFVYTITEDWGSPVSTDSTTAAWVTGKALGVSIGGNAIRVGSRCQGATITRTASAPASAVPRARRQGPTEGSQAPRAAGAWTGSAAIRARTWGQKVSQTASGGSATGTARAARKRPRAARSPAQAEQRAR